MTALALSNNVNTLIERIMAAAGDMPNPDAHRRYLATLSERALMERLAALTRGNSAAPQMEFWTPLTRNLKPTLA